jgi:hypothetical protein
MVLQPFVGPCWSLYLVGRTPWTGDQPVTRPLSAHRTAQIQNKCTQTSMPPVGFEPMIPVFQRVKTVHALDRAATVIGSLCSRIFKLTEQTCPISEQVSSNKRSSYAYTKRCLENWRYLLHGEVPEDQMVSKLAKNYLDFYVIRSLLKLFCL